MRLKAYDTIIIGGGQSALACAYYLRRTSLGYLLLDANEGPGGAWREMWDSLHLFSPAEHSSLPGWPMPGTEEAYPGRDHVIGYLKQYEARYEFPIRRGVEVENVYYENSLFRLETSRGEYYARTIISATGTWRRPYIPDYPGREQFEGEQWTVVDYQSPEPFRGKRVAIVGGGNSGAQVLAEVSKVAETFWATKGPPKFLPDEVDGYYLFTAATRRYKAMKEGKPFTPPPGGLGDIVMVPTVKEARERGVLAALPPFETFTPNGIRWADGREERIDAVIWCTGFRPALDHLETLYIRDENGRIRTDNTRAVGQPGLWLVGYGSWTGYASATLIGVGRSARQTVREVEERVKGKIVKGKG